MKNRKRLVSILAGIMAAIMLLTLIVGLIPVRANASSSEIRKQINELKKQKAEIEKQIEEVKEQYEENENEIANIVAQKNIVDQEIGLLSAQLVNINEQISAFNVLIADKQDELDTAEDRYNQLNLLTKDRIRAMEEDGSVSYWEVLFKANSFADLLDRMNMVEEIATSDQRRLKELGEAAQNVQIAQEALEEEKAELQITKDELDATQAELDAKRKEADALILELLAKAEELEALRAEFEEQEAAFLEEIAQKEQEYTEAKLEEWLAYMSTYVPPTTAPVEQPGNNGNTNTGNINNNNTNNNNGNTVNSSGWVKPIHGYVLTSPFGHRNSPTAGASSYHQGVDLSAPAGTPIYAARSGQVSVAGYGSAAGNYVTINHMDGFSSIYMHMTHFVVSRGQMVNAGQLIGYVGSSGVSTGNHLHFGIAYNGAYVNPCGYIPL